MKPLMPDWMARPSSLGKQIAEITDDGPVFETILYDAEGRQTRVEETTEEVYADSTIISISQGPKSKLVNTTEGLKASKNGLLMTDERDRQRYREYFASGDVVLGARTVVEAVAYPGWWQKPWMNI